MKDVIEKFIMGALTVLAAFLMIALYGLPLVFTVCIVKFVWDHLP